jgi:hypothetical protein
MVGNTRWIILQYCHNIISVRTALYMYKVVLITCFVLQAMAEDSEVLLIPQDIHQI